MIDLRAEAIKANLESFSEKIKRWEAKGICATTYWTYDEAHRIEVIEAYNREITNKLKSNEQ